MNKRSLVRCWNRWLADPLLAASKRLSRKGLYPFLETQAALIQPGQRVLSVGAGGQVSRRVRARSAELGYQVEELDISDTHRPDIQADICVWSNPGAYDFIFISEVLEHVSDPRQALLNLHASLRPGGRLVLSTPFMFPIHEAPYDYFRYTRHGLAMLLQPFSQVSIAERNSWAEALLVLLSRTIMSDNERLRLSSVVFVPLAYLLYPLAWLTGRFLGSEFFTTGYVATASKTPAE